MLSDASFESFEYKYEPRIYSRSLDAYQIIKVIGKGLMGKVLLVRESHSGKLFALKSINKEQLQSQSNSAHLWDERTVLLNHPSSPFLIILYAAFQNETHLFFLLEYHPGGDFASILGSLYRISEESAKFYAAEILLGLKALHKGGVVYRDLKPENVLLDRRGHVVLTDFGLSKPDAKHLLLRTFCGTAEYLAPEILQGRPYDFAVDLWSFGTMLYEMLLGVVPYWSENATEMYHRIVHDQVIPFPDMQTTDAAKDLVRRLLEKCPSKRLTDIDQIQGHPFFAGIDWTRAEQKQLEPPMIFNLKDEEDVSAFEPQFVQMSTDLSPGPMKEDAMNFRGFSFAVPSV